MTKRILLGLAILAVIGSVSWSAYSPGTFIIDSTGAKTAAVKSTTPLSGDNALACILHPNSAAIGVTGSFWQTTQPVSIASMPSTPVTGTFWQATQPVSGTFWQATQPVSIATMPSTPVTGTFWQATQPVSIASMPSTPVTGTFWQATQPVSVADGSSVALGAKADAAASDSTSSWSAIAIFKGLWAKLATISGQLPAALDGSGYLKIHEQGAAGKTYPNATAAFSQTSVSTAQTISAPANAVRVVIQNDSTGTDCIRYRFDGSAATSSVGMVLQPGQDSGQLDTGMSVSIVACSGTQKANIQYFAQ